MLQAQTSLPDAAMQTSLLYAPAPELSGPWVRREPPLHCINLSLPADPRSWSREQVAAWLRHMAAVHQLPHVPADRFLMNGKALCLMSMDMFLGRVPLGGKLLYKDFQLRLGRAMYATSTPAQATHS